MKSATFVGGSPRLSSEKEKDEIAKRISADIKKWAEEGQKRINKLADNIMKGNKRY